MTDPNAPLPTRPLRTDEQFMLERFSEAIADQSKLMDTLAQQLLLVELAIPGLYAISLKLVSGSDRLAFSWSIILAFGCWVLALGFTLMAIIPRQYVGVNRHSPDDIEAFFDQVAQRKRVLLAPSLVFFIIGIIFILYDLLS